MAVCHFYLFNGGHEVFEYVSALAVEVFFVLSGFVLASQINLVCDSRNRFANLKVFLLRRWMRTVPSYWVALLSSAIVFGFGTFQNLFAHMFYMQNVISDDPVPAFFSVAWSLSVEEWFYVYFPILLISLVRVSRSSHSRIYVSLSIILFFVVVRYVAGDRENWGEDIRRAVVFRLDAIVYGYLAYSTKDSLSISKTVTVVLTAGIMFSVMNYSYMSLPQSTFLQNVFPVLNGLLFGGIMILLSKLSGRITGRTARMLDVAARLTYPIYLFHLIVIGLLIQIDLSHLMSFFFIVHLFAFMFHYAFEVPILAARPHYSDKRQQES